MGAAAYFFLHYAVMTAFFAQDESNLDSMMEFVSGAMGGGRGVGGGTVGGGGLDLGSLPEGFGQVTFASIVGGMLYSLKLTDVLGLPTQGTIV